MCLTLRSFIKGETKFTCRAAPSARSETVEPCWLLTEEVQPCEEEADRTSASPSALGQIRRALQSMKYHRIDK